ncbi:hypothetical protein C8R45DRAFT_935330 [Mycena sanguinolenta]|nr:hypothetical protein C8R45DRAFT_935330 [Mycena sanguinolenta]
MDSYAQAQLCYLPRGLDPAFFKLAQVGKCTPTQSPSISVVLGPFSPEFLAIQESLSIQKFSPSPVVTLQRKSPAHLAQRAAILPAFAPLLRLHASGNPFCALLIPRIPVVLQLVERVHLTSPALAYPIYALVSPECLKCASESAMALDASISDLLALGICGVRSDPLAASTVGFLLIAYGRQPLLVSMIFISVLFVLPRTTVTACHCSRVSNLAT